MVAVAALQAYGEAVVTDTAISGDETEPIGLRL